MRREHQKFHKDRKKERCTVLLPGLSRSTSGAIQPSVPGIPDRKEKLERPSWIFLHRPKSEMRARTWPSGLGLDSRMFLGFRSRWTTGDHQRKEASFCAHTGMCALHESLWGLLWQQYNSMTPSTFKTLLRVIGVTRVSPGRVIPWTSRQFITGPHRRTII